MLNFCKNQKNGRKINIIKINMKAPTPNLSVIHPSVQLTTTHATHFDNIIIIISDAYYVLCKTLEKNMTDKPSNRQTHTLSSVHLSTLFQLAMQHKVVRAATTNCGRELLWVGGPVLAPRPFWLYEEGQL